jgi:hypothetical protein
MSVSAELRYAAAKRSVEDSLNVKRASLQAAADNQRELELDAWLTNVAIVVDNQALQETEKRKMGLEEEIQRRADVRFKLRNIFEKREAGQQTDGVDEKWFFNTFYMEIDNVFERRQTFQAEDRIRSADDRLVEIEDVDQFTSNGNLRYAQKLAYLPMFFVKAVILEVAARATTDLVERFRKIDKQTAVVHAQKKTRKMEMQLEMPRSAFPSGSVSVVVRSHPVRAATAAHLVPDFYGPIDHAAIRWELLFNDPGVCGRTAHSNPVAPVAPPDNLSCRACEQSGNT